MSSVIDLIRAAAVRGSRAVGMAQPAPSGPHYQGYIDERSTHHVAGWIRDLADTNRRIDYEVVLPGADGGERVVHRGRADAFSEVLVKVDVGDGTYAFDADLEPPITEAERDSLFVRPAGSTWRLDLAPAMKTKRRLPPETTPEPTPPPALAPTPREPAPAPRPVITALGPFQGYIDERSTHHVTGWIRDLSDLAARVPFEVVVPGPGGERIVQRGCADTFSNLLLQIGVGDGQHSFYLLFNEPITPAERDVLFVRPTGSAHRLELAPALKSVFEPISHIAMDIVNNCNLRCPFCVYDYANTRATKFMSDETFDAALRLIPFVTDGNFWLSCLHEATLHPRLVQFIERVPAEHRRKLFYTTNLAKPMKQAYFDFLANAGLHHINISLESFDPAVYEKMRKGARHRIFNANWATLLATLPNGSAPPRLRYNIMAYRSNLAEIPHMVEVLLNEKQAWQVEIRHTYDEPHIPTEFRDGEFLTSAEWAWLQSQLAHHDPEVVGLIMPPHGVGYDVPVEASAAAMPIVVAPQPEAAEEIDDDAELALETGGAPSPVDEPSMAMITPAGHRYDRIPRPLQLSMDWEGTLKVYGEEPRGPGQPPIHVNYVMTNIGYLKDPIRFLLAL